MVIAVVAVKTFIIRAGKTQELTLEEDASRSISSLKIAISATVEFLIEMLDRLDGDSDLEPDEDCGIDDVAHDGYSETDRPLEEVDG